MEGIYKELQLLLRQLSLLVRDQYCFIDETAYEDYINKLERLRTLSEIYRTELTVD